MIKIFVATLIGLGVAGGTVAMAEAPAKNTGTPSSTTNIRLVREQVVPPLPIPAGAKAPQWWALARQVGWAEDALPTLDYIIFRESRGLNRAFNRQDPNGGSRCLLQLNGSWTGWLTNKGIITKPSDLFKPATCLTAGLAIYQYGMDRYGFGWGPWAIKP